MSADPIVNRCACCGREHRKSGWEGLAFVGYVIDDIDALELRNCPCGSTQSVEITRTGAPRERTQDR